MLVILGLLTKIAASHSEPISDHHSSIRAGQAACVDELRVQIIARTGSGGLFRSIWEDVLPLVKHHKKSLL